MSVGPAHIFNDVILGYIVLFFAKQGLFPVFAAGATPDQLVTQFGFDEKKLSVILKSAEIMGILTHRNGAYYLTKLGEELRDDRGFFTLFIGGYSQLLEAMGTTAAPSASNHKEYVRGQYVAIGSDEAQQASRPIFDKVIDGLKARHIADLGCGNGGRLIDLLQRRPDTTAVGIDIDPASIHLATENRDKHQLQHRLQFVQEDVFKSLETAPAELKNVELVMSFMMLHDLFNMSELKGQLFQRMKAAFPNAKYFVLADTCLDENEHNAETMPVFTLGYELVHALRGIQIFPLSYYEEQFRQGGLKLITRHDFGVPNTHIFVLEP